LKTIVAAIELALPPAQLCFARRLLQKSTLMTGFSAQAYSKGYALQKLGAKRSQSKQP
jgi:hypothetical protein